MLTRDEIVRSLTGAFEIFLDRPDAMRHFTLSVAGFWRSFGAIALVAPVYALSALAERQVALNDAVHAARFDDGLFSLDKILALGIDWITLPLLLALIAGRIGIGRTYPAFIIARNWGSVVATVPFGIVGILFVFGVIDAEAADILSLAMLFVVLRYNYLIARRALEVAIGFAVVLVVADFALSMLIAAAVDGIIGP
jgi:hypothetical protein